jgi:hypothetical protein
MEGDACGYVRVGILNKVIFYCSVSNRQAIARVKFSCYFLLCLVFA